MENILRPLVIYIYIYICPYKINFYIFLCFKWGGWGGFYKHLEKCLQEMTIVPHGVIMSQSVAISFFFFSSPLSFLGTYRT